MKPRLGPPPGTPLGAPGRERDGPGIPAGIPRPRRQNRASAPRRPAGPRRGPGRPPGSPDAPQGRQSAREAYYRAQTRKIEQELRARAGEFVDVAAVERRWAGMTLAVRERLLALPTTARQRGLVDVAGEAALRQLVEQALAELAERAAAR
jgi:hypothetical protein